MHHSAIHDPYAGTTPSQRLAAAARSLRLEKFAAKACEDTPIVLRVVPPPKQPEPVFSLADWIERQKQIPLPVRCGPPTIRDIQIASCRHFEIELKSMLSECRRDYFVRPRQVAMFLSHEFTGKSSLFIGRAFFRDHATVLWGIRKIARLLTGDDELVQDLADIRAALARRPS